MLIIGGSLSTMIECIGQSSVDYWWAIIFNDNLWLQNNNGQSVTPIVLDKKTNATLGYYQPTYKSCSMKISIKEELFLRPGQNGAWSL